MRKGAKWWRKIPGGGTTQESRCLRTVFEMGWVKRNGPFQPDQNCIKKNEYTLPFRPFPQIGEFFANFKQRKNTDHKYKIVQERWRKTKVYGGFNNHSERTSWLWYRGPVIPIAMGWLTAGPRSRQNSSRSQRRGMCGRSLRFETPRGVRKRNHPATSDPCHCTVKLNLHFPFQVKGNAGFQQFFSAFNSNLCVSFDIHMSSINK